MPWRDSHTPIIHSSLPLFFINFGIDLSNLVIPILLLPFVVPFSSPGLRQIACCTPFPFNPAEDVVRLINIFRHRIHQANWENHAFHADSQWADSSVQQRSQQWSRTNPIGRLPVGQVEKLAVAERCCHCSFNPSIYCPHLCSCFRSYSTPQKVFSNPSASTTKRPRRFRTTGLHGSWMRFGSRNTSEEHIP